MFLTLINSAFPVTMEVIEMPKVVSKSLLPPMPETKFCGKAILVVLPRTMVMVMTGSLKMVAHMKILTALKMVMVKNQTKVNGRKNGRGRNKIIEKQLFSVFVEPSLKKSLHLYLGSRADVHASILR